MADLVLDPGHHALLDQRDVHAVEHVAEEAGDDQADGLLARDAAGLEVEQRAGVDLAGGGAMAGGDVRAEDLQERRGVGTRAVGEDQRAVVLVGDGADGVLDHQDVAAEDGAAVPCSEPLNSTSLVARGREVADVGLQVEPLALVGGVDAGRVGLAAGGDEVGLGPHAHGAPAEVQLDRVEAGVALHPALVQGEVVDAAGPVLES